MTLNGECVVKRRERFLKTLWWVHASFQLLLR